MLILGLLGFLKCSDTGDWPEAEFSFPCDIFCFEGTYVAAVARNQAVISEEEVFSFWDSKAKIGVVVDINCEGLGFFSNTSKDCLLYTSPSPRDPKTSRMPSSA